MIHARLYYAIDLQNERSIIYCEPYLHSTTRQGESVIGVTKLTERLTVSVEDGIGAMLIELAGGSRRQGEYITRLVRAAWEMEQAGKTAGVELEGVRLQLAGLSGKVTTIDGRLLSVEAQVSAMIARTAATPTTEGK